MNKIYFITWNEHKFAEASNIVFWLEQLELDLDEIQELNPQRIIQSKLKQARRFQDWLIMVEDVWLYFDAMNWFPWPLIKWYLKSNNLDKIVSILEYLWNTKAYAWCLIWILDEDNIEHYFEWKVYWTIVKSRWSTKFWWDSIFLPDWFDLTFGEMSLEQKNLISHRAKALELLNNWLNNK